MKKVLCVALVLALVLCLFPFTALADGNEVKVDGVEYATVAEGLSHVADNSVVEFLKSEITLTDAIAIQNSKNVTVKGLTTADGKPGTTLNGGGTGDNNGIFRWCYCKDSFTIENLIINPTPQYGIHFDGGSGTLNVKNCSIKGTVAIADTVTNSNFTDCTFAGRSGSGHCNINLYADGTFKNCTFSADYTSGSSRGILALGAAATQTVKMEGCSVANNGTLSDVFRRDYKTFGVMDAKIEGSKFSAGSFVADAAAVSRIVAADGYEVVNMGNDLYVIAAKQDTNGNITVYENEPEKEISQDIPAAQQEKVAEIIDKMDVADVNLTDAAQETLIQAAGVDETKDTRIFITVDAVVEEAEIQEAGTLTFSLTPFAQVYQQNDAGTAWEAKGGLQPVTNSMLEGGAITVILPCGDIVPKQVVHRDDNGTLIEAFNEGQFTYDAAAKTVTVKINHFSKLTVNGTPENLSPKTADGIPFVLIASLLIAIAAAGMILTKKMTGRA